MQHERQRRLRTRLQWKQIADFYYLIDVVGTCNLRCPSCPVGNYTQRGPLGFMSPVLFSSILDKIRAEHQTERVFLDLYNWGEPALHPELSTIIALAKEKQFGCGISCNLNVFPDIENVVRSAPDYIRISVSGITQSVYQQTHRRGNIERVLANMRLLREHLDHYRSDTIVQVGFHIYRSNFPDDFNAMKQLCDELGFIFAPTIATFMPVEKAVEALNGASVMEPALRENFVLGLKDWSEAFAPLRSEFKDCHYRRDRTTINFDGSVALCCATFEPEQVIAENFLEHSRAEIRRRKYAHAFCRTCQSKNLDMMYSGVDPTRLDEMASAELGSEYRAFLAEWNRPLIPTVDWGGEVISLKRAYELANELRAADRLEEALALCRTVVESYPDRAEAKFELAKTFRSQGELQTARDWFDAALRILPDKPSYLEFGAELERLGV
jgi:MoaA/NifB/PqqE/SkfB family radical SAM enzyme